MRTNIIVEAMPKSIEEIPQKDTLLAIGIIILFILAIKFLGKMLRQFIAK